MSAQVIQIVEKHFFSHDILRLRLKAEAPIEFYAGQYILLGFDREILKPFSIAAAPDGSGELECHIRYNPDSPWMQTLFTKEIGDRLYWQGPIDHICLREQTKPTIFVAGGTGFALMKALLEKQLESTPTYPIHIYWGVRQATDLYQHDWLVKLCQQYNHIHYTPVISEADANWQGITGWVHNAVLKDFPILENFVVYLCGPAEMQQVAKQAFLAAGLTEENFVY